MFQIFWKCIRPKTRSENSVFSISTKFSIQIRFQFLNKFEGLQLADYFCYNLQTETSSFALGRRYTTSFNHKQFRELEKFKLRHFRQKDILSTCLFAFGLCSFSFAKLANLTFPSKLALVFALFYIIPIRSIFKFLL